MKKLIMNAGALVVACISYGAGFQVLEQGASNIGSALAGATANASSDASSAFWNPSASIFSDTIKVGDIDMESGINFVVPSFEFNNQGTTGPGGNEMTGGFMKKIAWLAAVALPACVGLTAAEKIAVSSPSGDRGPEKQNVEKTIDGDPATKWCTRFRPGMSWLIELPQPGVMHSYAFTHAEDINARDPKKWRVEGSTDGVAFETISAVLF